MAKKEKVTKVSSSTLDNSLQQGKGFGPDAKRDSEEAREMMRQRDFLGNSAKPAFTSAADARRRYDQEWLARNLFWRGYHFSRYVPQTQTVVLSTRQQARVPVNLIASNMRAIRNQVTSFRPKFEVLPSNPKNESAKVQARYAQRLLDYYFDRLKLKMKIKETITQALLYSVGGPWQIIYDEDTKEVKLWLLDPFDFYVDPLAEDFEDAEYVIKAVRQPISKVVHNPHFNIWARKEVTGPSANLAASEYKQFMIQALKAVSPRNANESPMIILYEGYFKRRRPENGEVYMVKCIWTEQNQIPLLYEEIETDQFDFIMYRGDLSPKEIYGESWIKHVMPINRVIDSLESSAFEYNYRVAKGRIVVDRDSGVRAIHNVHGEIISKNRGAEVKALDMAPLPVAVPQQIERMWRYMEDVSGIHEASLGRVPTGVKTGIGIAELKQADATSQDDLVDNLEDFLSDVGFKILQKIAENYSTFKVIKDLGVRDGEEEYFVAIGRKYAKGRNFTEKDGKRQVKIGADWFDVAMIDDDNNIRVTVGSWLGYTKEALQQKVISYFQMQLIDQSTALRLLEFGDIDEIIQQTRMEMLLKRPAQPGPNGEPGIDQLGLAQSENDMFLDGKLPPAQETDDHMVHIALHQEMFGRGVDDLVGAHLDQHKELLGSAPPIDAGNGIDMADQGRMAAVTAQRQPAPMGPPPGTELPQQDLASVMGQNAQTAGAMMGMQ